MNNHTDALHRTDILCDCEYITDSIKTGILKDHFHRWEQHSPKIARIGSQPNKMPTPFITPINIWHSAQVKPLIEGKILIYAQAQRVHKYGIYHTILALFEKNLWLARERNGALTLREYDKTVDFT